MRRSDKALPVAAVIKILQEGEYGVLSTVDAEGQPYGVPLNYALKDSNIYFHCALTGHKLDNLLANDKVSFCVVGQSKVVPVDFTSEFASVIVTGSAELIDADEKYEALVSLIEKYSPEFIEEGRQYIDKFDAETAAVALRIDSMTGKRSPV